ncbi:Rve-domain-containing hypothetical protein [Phytophthora megakarya]|uniref:Integrase catalytic domain-containing protein n=1 Tax=Phytophthora megakarya TaxID=4795 RepID=A0A225UDH3_9STRA|nr:Rve-domain-containing hypothetical protein [Phytophthora megakarya]
MRTLLCEGSLSIQVAYFSQAYVVALAFVIRKKSAVQIKVKELLLQLEREDGGTAFVNAALKTFCTDMGVNFQTSNPLTPEENGAAERDHQPKMGKVRCALRDANLPAKWWPEALKSEAVCASHMRLKLSGRTKSCLHGR